MVIVALALFQTSELHIYLPARLAPGPVRILCDERAEIVRPVGRGLPVAPPRPTRPDLRIDERPLSLEYSEDGGLALLEGIYDAAGDRIREPRFQTISVPDAIKISPVAVDSDGNLFVAGLYGHLGSRARRIDGASGIITSLPMDASHNSIAVDAAGNVYGSDYYGNRTITRFSPKTQSVTVMAGGSANLGDGEPATGAIIRQGGMTADGSGNLYIADQYQRRVRRVDAVTGKITTVVSATDFDFNRLCQPNALALDAARNLLYMADSTCNQVRRLNLTTGTLSNVVDPDGQPILFQGPTAIRVNSAGDLFVSETFAHRVLKISAATNQVTTVAGTGAAGFTGDNGPATSARLALPKGIELDATGNLFIADFSNSRIRKVDAATQNITTVFTGSNTFGSDLCCSPQMLELDGTGRLLFSELKRNLTRIRRLDPASGAVSIVAGGGTRDDGVAATDSVLWGVHSIAAFQGNIFVSEIYPVFRIRVIRGPIP
jgi:sugar lactone lactonase YvrE